MGKLRDMFWNEGLVKTIVTRMESLKTGKDGDLSKTAQEPSCPIMFRMLAALVKWHPTSQNHVVQSDVLRMAFDIEEMPASEVNNVGNLSDRLLTSVCLGNKGVEARLEE